MPNKMDIWPFEDDEHHDVQPFAVSNFTAFSASIEFSENINPYKDLFKGFSPTLLYFATICITIFMLVGIPGNLFTIIALARCKKVRNATAVFIINLSCSDLLFCCFNLPLAATTFYYREWVHGDEMCRLFPVLRYGLLAVSLFTILAITINRYIMIGHPRIYPKRKWLALMVALTWLCSFGTLIQTWKGKWGKFGMDTKIDSCSILPSDETGKTPKEFLFVMAFILPCFAIVLCYARIFYIVRKTAMKTHEASKKNGSIRMHNHLINKNNNNNINNKINNIAPMHQKAATLQKSENDKIIPINLGIQRPSIEIEECNEQNFELPNFHKIDDLKFIDTTSYCDNSNFSNTQSVQVSIENVALQSSSSLSPTIATTAESTITIPTTIISLENENERMQQQQLIPINAESDGLNVVGTNVHGVNKTTHDMGVDSAVEDSTVSLEQNNHAQYLLSIPEPSSSSSGIELPYDMTESPKKKKTKKSPIAKIRHKKIKEEPPANQAIRQKSLGNNSSASVLHAGRMSSKDRRLLKMILVIFISFLICYLPITLTKVVSSLGDVHFLFILSYLLIYLTTCINPIIYVVMSSEYRQAYKQLFMCRSSGGCNANNARGRM